jgi:hypothetical protein
MTLADAVADGDDADGADVGGGAAASQAAASSTTTKANRVPRIRISVELTRSARIRLGAP